MGLVFVSGASGFLGRALSTQLLSLGYTVRGLVRSSDRAGPLKELGAEIVVGDIRDPGIRGAIADAETVIHCAAAIGPPSLPREVMRSTNVDGTRNLVGILKAHHRLKRFVHISTVAVVGTIDPQDPAREETPCRPLDWYAETKLMAEHIVLDAARTGFPSVIARPMWIYGSQSLVTANLFRKIARRKLPMIGSARNTMQPIAIEDAVAAVLKCAATPGIEGRVYNIAGPEILTVRSMCETIAQAMGTTLPRVPVPLPVALILATVSENIFPLLRMTPPLNRKKLEFFRICHSYSIDRAKQELGWNPEVTFRHGALRVADELRATPELGVRPTH